MQALSQIITKIVDFFYRPFSRYIPLQLFRYAACGGGNWLKKALRRYRREKSRIRAPRFDSRKIIGKEERCRAFCRGR